MAGGWRRVVFVCAVCLLAAGGGGGRGGILVSGSALKKEVKPDASSSPSPPLARSASVPVGGRSKPKLQLVEQPKAASAANSNAALDKASQQKPSLGRASTTPASGSRKDEEQPNFRSVIDAEAIPDEFNIGNEAEADKLRPLRVTNAQIVPEPLAPQHQYQRYCLNDLAPQYLQISNSDKAEDKLFCETYAKEHQREAAAMRQLATSATQELNKPEAAQLKAQALAYELVARQQLKKERAQQLYNEEMKEAEPPKNVDDAKQLGPVHANVPPPLPVPNAPPNPAVYPANVNKFKVVKPKLALVAPIGANLLEMQSKLTSQLPGEPGSKWSETHVPYYKNEKLKVDIYDEKIDLKIRWVSLFVDWAINHIEARTCLRFINVGKTFTVMKIGFYYAKSGCVTFGIGDNMIGRALRETSVSIANGCGPDGTAHEILHAVGFDHMQNRFDRSKYINIHWSNISPLWMPQYFTVSKMFFKLYGPYDFTSVMQYGGQSYEGKDKAGQPIYKTVMTEKTTGIDPKRVPPVGSPWDGKSSSHGLSDDDARDVNTLYCPGTEIGAPHVLQGAQTRPTAPSGTEPNGRHIKYVQCYTRGKERFAALEDYLTDGCMKKDATNFKCSRGTCVPNPSGAKGPCPGTCVCETHSLTKDECLCVAPYDPLRFHCKPTDVTLPAPPATTAVDDTDTPLLAPAVPPRRSREPATATDKQ